MAKFGEHTCPKCNEKQWSISDNNYLEQFGQCWGCDKKEWEAGRLSLEEFERRERIATSA